MRWHVETWRKLYRTCSPGWLRLSVSARGLGSELLKYCDDDGSIAIGADDPGVAIAYLLGARPREHRRIREDVAELLGDGYLVRAGDKLQIRNFVEAQDRTPGARRTAEWRARKSEAEASRVTSRGASQVTGGASHVTSPVRGDETSIRSDPIRSEEEEKIQPTAARSPIQPGARVQGRPAGLEGLVVEVLEGNQAAAAVVASPEAVRLLADRAFSHGLKAEEVREGLRWGVERLEVEAVELGLKADDPAELGRALRVLQGGLAGEVKRRRVASRAPSSVSVQRDAEGYSFEAEKHTRERAIAAAREKGKGSW